MALHIPPRGSPQKALHILPWVHDNLLHTLALRYLELHNLVDQHVAYQYQELSNQGVQELQGQHNLGSQYEECLDILAHNPILRRQAHRKLILPHT